MNLFLVFILKDNKHKSTSQNDLSHAPQNYISHTSYNDISHAYLFEFADNVLRRQMIANINVFIPVYGDRNEIGVNISPP